MIPIAHTLIDKQLNMEAKNGLLWGLYIYRNSSIGSGCRCFAII